MNLRWYLLENGERVLQYSTAFGWENVPEESEAEESMRRQTELEEEWTRMEAERMHRIRRSGL
jgi:hypothetical protein